MATVFYSDFIGESYKNMSHPMSNRSYFPPKTRKKGIAHPEMKMFIVPIHMTYIYNVIYNDVCT